MRFNELRLAEPIVRAVTAEGYTTPTPIQAKAIPAALAGKDLLGCAQTGTGKTGAFALPILQRLIVPTGDNGSRARNGSRRRTPRALILCPTRELAAQILDSFNAYGRYTDLRHTVVFGGVSKTGQIRKLRAGTDILVATPGRLLDLLNQGFVDLRAVEVFVLDEADRMLDMGFIRDIQKIAEHVPPRRQTLFFSATMPGAIRRLADSILNDPIFVQAAVVASTVEAIAQQVYFVARKDKPVLLRRLLERDEVKRTLIFTRTKYGADKLVTVLRRSGVDAGAIHGNKNQNARTRALKDFKSGRMPVLVATDIASRGIDVDDITHVINFDMPNDSETYVHRIGRTARAGASGTSLSFCAHDELSDLRAIERLIDKKLDVMEDEPDLLFEAPAAPRDKRRGVRGGGRPAPRRRTESGNRHSRAEGGAGGGRRKRSGSRASQSNANQSHSKKPRSSRSRTTRSRQPTA